MSAQINGTWQYIVLDNAVVSGYRVKRRKSVLPTPPFSGPVQPDIPGGSTWSKEAQKIVTYNGVDYIFAFWSLTAHNNPNGNNYAQILHDRYATVTLGPPGTWEITAKAWYTYKIPDTGGGDNAIFIDAFDIDLGDFIADDFVDVVDLDAQGVEVVPDVNAAALTKAGNDGYIDTDAQIPAGQMIKITARSVKEMQWYTFSSWQLVDSLTVAGDPSSIVRASDIAVHQGDRIVAFAFYNEIPRPFIPPIISTLFPVLVIQMSDAGKVWGPIGGGNPGPGPDPILGLVASMRLLQDAYIVDSDLRGTILASAEKMALEAAKEIRKLANQKLTTNSKSKRSSNQRKRK